MKIYQVQNETGNPASREGNEEAIFLDPEKAQGHIDFLYNECGLDDMTFKIVEIGKSHYFTLTQETLPIAIVEATNNKNFEYAIRDAAREHFMAEETQLKNSLLIDDYTGESKEIEIELFFDDEEDQAYNFEIVSCFVYDGK